MPSIDVCCSRRRFNLLQSARFWWRRRLSRVFVVYPVFFQKVFSLVTEQISDAGEHRKWARLLSKEVSTNPPAQSGSNCVTSPDKPTMADMYEEIRTFEKNDSSVPPLLYEDIDAVCESEMNFVFFVFLNETTKRLSTETVPRLAFMSGKRFY